jgi:predicted ester cyclase
LNKAFPDHHTTIEDQIAEGDRVVTRVTFKGTHLGEFNGIAPTGKVLTYSGVAVDRVVDVKVVEKWHVASPLELPIQIGVVLVGLPAAR